MIISNRFAKLLIIIQQMQDNSPDRNENDHGIGDESYINITS